MTNSSSIVSLPRFFDERGNLSFFENNVQLPFAIKRVHWIYDVPGGEARGGLAYRQAEEFIVALSGSFDVTIDDGTLRQKFTLNRSYMGLYVPKGTWRGIDNFSTNSVAVIAASTHYDPDDSIRDYQDFLDFAVKSKDAGKVELDVIPTVETEGRFSIYDCSIIELDRHHSQRKGDISVVENGETVPFDVKRVYYLYDVPGGVERGGHAHKVLSQLIVSVSGAFTVTLNDGKVKRSFALNRPYQGLLVKPGIWRDLSDFSSGSVCLVLASEKYDASDYIRDFDEFLKYRR